MGTIGIFDFMEITVFIWCSVSKGPGEANVDEAAGW
jgi:hypothetical protein